jgi:hypothetical protein
MGDDTRFVHGFSKDSRKNQFRPVLDADEAEAATVKS